MRRWISLLLAALLLGAMGWSAAMAAGTEGQRVFDQAGLFSAQGAQSLEDALAGAIRSTGLDMAVVTTGDAGGRTAREYADDFYDDNAIGKDLGDDGLLFLIDMDNREAWISTYGKAVDHINDDRVQDILDDAYNGLASGDYEAAAMSFVQGAERWALADIDPNQHRYDEETGKVAPYRSVSAGQLLLFGGISLGAGGAACAGVTAKYRLRIGSYRYPYREKIRMALSRREDTFLHQTLTQRQIRSDPPPSSGSRSGGRPSGRSTTHRSSSGRSHGGGGRKF